VPLARLIAQASRSSQLWVTTHSRTLAEQIEAFSGLERVELTMVKGETRIVGQGLVLPDYDEDE
jgi:predicted ATPase